MRCALLSRGQRCSRRCVCRARGRALETAISTAHGANVRVARVVVNWRFATKARILDASRLVAIDLSSRSRRSLCVELLLVLLLLLSGRWTPLIATSAQRSVGGRDGPASVDTTRSTSGPTRTRTGVARARCALCTRSTYGRAVAASGSWARRQSSPALLLQATRSSRSRGIFAVGIATCSSSRGESANARGTRCGCRAHATRARWY